MNKLPLIAIVVITNASGTNLLRTSSEWIREGGIPGVNLFFCGPRASLESFGIKDEAIIDYIDRPYYLGCFHINEKKRFACEAVKAEYIYLVHDRFFPEGGFLNKLAAILNDKNYDFGAVDVVNLDGSLALSELRLKASASKLDLDKALEPIGRLVCDKVASDASEFLAINGGQFFLKRAMIKHLGRPMRWVEMEDDILSHDFRDARGVWISEARLVSIVSRKLANIEDSTLRTNFRYYIYRIICNILARVICGVSVGQKIDNDMLQHLIKKNFLLVDPMHKMTSSGHLISSLEKLTARARIIGGGRAWSRVERVILGWRLYE